jgi:hypothetical protein
MNKNKKLNKLFDLLSKKNKKLQNANEKYKVMILNKIFSNHLNISNDKNVYKNINNKLF